MTKRQSNLQSLFRRIPITPIGPVPSVRISGISLVSREVQPGMLFAALKGEKADGLDFIPQAVERLIRLDIDSSLLYIHGNSHMEHI